MYRKIVALAQGKHQIVEPIESAVKERQRI